MARITKKRKVGNAAPIATGLAVGLPMLAFGPVGILGFFLVYGIAKKGIAQDIEKEGAREDAEDITNTWLNNRFVGEREISVRREKPMGGLLPIPMSVTYTTRLHDIEESDARHTDNLAELDLLRRHAKQSVKTEIEERMRSMLGQEDDLVSLSRTRMAMASCSSMRDKVDSRLRQLIEKERDIVMLLHARDDLYRSPNMRSIIKSRIRFLTQT